MAAPPRRGPASIDPSLYIFSASSSGYSIGLIAPPRIARPLRDNCARPAPRKAHVRANRYSGEGCRLACSGQRQTHRPATAAADGGIAPDVIRARPSGHAATPEVPLERASTPPATRGPTGSTRVVTGM